MTLCGKYLKPLPRLSFDSYSNNKNYFSPIARAHEVFVFATQSNCQNKTKYSGPYFTHTVTKK
jgi:hypothetical protein